MPNAPVHPHTFVERLTAGPLLGDGAMGTMLYACGVPFDHCFDALNLSAPDLPRGIHVDYLRAGAELIETNTFGANRFKLGAHGLQDQVREMNVAGVAAAREACAEVGVRAWVAGSMGPIGRPMVPLGAVTSEEVREAFHEQAAALAEGGADLLILETFSDLNELREAILGAREAAALPIAAEMTFTQEGKTLLGHTPEEIVAALEALGVQALGANCSVGSQGILQVMEAMALVSHTPLVAMPNAGFPAYVGGRYIYVSTPPYMAEHARRMLERGVSIVGGCCGTTPEHIAAMAPVVRDFRSRGRTRPAPAGVRTPAEAPVEGTPAGGTITLTPLAPAQAATTRTGEGLTLAERLGRHFVITVEIDPPRGVDDSKEMAGCRRLREAGVDAIDVGDNPLARLRMSPWAMCARVQQEVGLDTILHFTTRDRNLVRLQSDLLAVHALGVRSVLVLRGDPPQLGDYPNATAVLDVTPSGLARLIKNFNQGIDVAGNSIGQPTSFLVGVALNMGARALDKEMRVLERKISAGADFVCTMPIYEVETFDRFVARFGGVPIPILVGVMPLQSDRHAEFLHNELPGSSIPEWVRERMRRAGSDGREEGHRMALELVEVVGQRAAGVYLIPSFGRYRAMADLVRGIRNLHVEAGTK
ncbi:MAG: bifunctional homocysteine S-methyltransferase/methylenetetrahydrofolate reductase [Armatimonadetes bacterium]|nr:bifunctional homocysteine S-methyltransferase/methylenetetrahydrofolate reductase [Armatimonadota bacterium]